MKAFTYIKKGKFAFVEKAKPSPEGRQKGVKGMVNTALRSV